MEVVEKFFYGGWKNCVKLENDVFSLIATTDIGPRIMSFGFKDGINLFQEIESDMGRAGGGKWRLYGGTRLWHAPEEIPRSYYPDNHPVAYEWNGKDLILVQGTEKTTGLQKEIRIMAGSNKSNTIEINYRIYNRSQWPVRFATWALSVMRKKGRVIIPQEPYQDHNENLLPVRPVVLWAYTDMADKRWQWGRRYIQLTQDPAARGPQKIGLLNRQGWIAYYFAGNMLIKGFKFEDDASYPDYQSNFETYTDPDIIELETLGPLATVVPGSFTEHKEKWTLFRIELDNSEDSIERKIKPLLEKATI